MHPGLEVKGLKMKVYVSEPCDGLGGLKETKMFILHS